MTVKTLTLRAPDDWHCHLRDNDLLATTVLAAAKQFKRAIVMPNLESPVTTVEKALAYRDRIVKHIPKGYDFMPLMTLYLTQHTTPQDINDAIASDAIIGCKLYPANVTTLSQSGVNDIHALYGVFEAMQNGSLPLLIHGEVNDPECDVFDRERIFIEKTLSTLVKDFPRLKIVFEHITTEAAVAFVQAQSSFVAATITPHHLYVNRNAMLLGGIHPHYYCLPILKRKRDQEALIRAATSGSPKFFIGTDSAPHPQTKKESACGCAGIFHPHALSLYATVFEKHNALDKLEAFISQWGPEFYNLPLNSNTITLQQSNVTVPGHYSFGHDKVIPFLAGETLSWELLNEY